MKSHNNPIIIWIIRKDISSIYILWNLWSQEVLNISIGIPYDIF